MESLRVRGNKTGTSYKIFVKCDSNELNCLDCYAKWSGGMNINLSYSLYCQRNTLNAKETIVYSVVSSGGGN